MAPRCPKLPPMVPGQVLVEGANAALLDIDFGTYPFVTWRGEPQYFYRVGIESIEVNCSRIIITSGI